MPKGKRREGWTGKVGDASDSTESKTRGIPEKWEWMA
jgi:hypothetical protein